MSWQDYVDNNLVGTKCVRYAAICDHSGTIWAKSQDWNAAQPELALISKNFSDPSTLAMTGITLAGEKFIYLSGDESILRAKKGTSGIHIAKTKTAMIVGKYEDPTQPNQCAKVIEGLAEYLSNQNY